MDNSAATEIQREADIRAISSQSIETECVCPPIPVRNFDWTAYFDPEPGAVRGWGETEKGAIEDLLETAGLFCRQCRKHPVPTTCMMAGCPVGGDL